MKEGMHPDYPSSTVACACGNTLVTRSTRGDFQVDVCAACHPFYTGTQKLMDTAGRVDRFKRRYAETKKPAPAAAAAPTPKSAKAPKAASSKAASASEGEPAAAEATPAAEEKSE
jgi:large subunit ribosomal protein L31